MRLFVGIPLAEAVTEEVAALTARLKRKDDGLRWSAPESWHITLQFLGSTTEEQYGCVTAALGGVAGAPVAVQLTELGVFERAGVFHVDVALTAELAELQRRVTRANEACGFVAEARTYHPHITLARIQRKAGRGTETGRGQALREAAARAGKRPRFTRFIAEEFLLYESVPGPAGSRYVARERFRFSRAQLVN